MRDMGTPAVCFLLFLAALGVAGAASAGPGPLEYRTRRIAVADREREVVVPRGYAFEVLATGLDEPRLATFGPGGDLFLGSRGGKVYRLPVPYREAEVLVELDGYPHGVSFRPGEILIARTDGLYRAPYARGQRRIERRDVTRLARLPGGGGHSSRTVRVGPDGRVYVSLGIAGNCSDQFLGESYPFEDRRGGVLVLDEGGASPRWRPFASGLRNPVGFDWQPGTGALFASNNGPDHWGFDLPPEYFSRLAEGSFHGMPWFQYDGRQVVRDRCLEGAPPRPREDVVVPVATFPARNAPMGVAFVPRGAMDPALEGDAIVALHGSWATAPSGGFFGDRSTRRPPKVVAVRFDGAQPRRVDDLVTGFQLPDGTRWARPVGVAVGPDGALYVTSDEGAEGLFRLRREGD